MSAGLLLALAAPLYLACVAAVAFFAGTETGMISLNRARLRHLAETGSRRAALICRWVQRPEIFINTTLIGTNLAVVTATAVITWACVRLFGDHRGPALATVVSTAIVLVFGEVLPKSLFRQYANQLMVRFARAFHAGVLILLPASQALAVLVRAIFRVLNLAETPRQSAVSKEELKLLLQTGEEEGVFTDDEQEMITQVFAMGKKRVREIMIPLIEVEMVPESAGADELLALARRTGFSRFPVYRGRVDRVVGLVNIFDLLLAPRRPRRIAEIIRPVHFVPELKPADELLRDLQHHRAVFAVVVDEFGGAVGIVTLEDIVEEIVGEIRDEGDEPELWYRKLDTATWVLDGTSDLDKVNAELGFQFPKDGYDTLSGFILARLGRLPREGEKLAFNDALLTVLKMEAQAIERVKLERIEFSHPDEIEVMAP